MEGQQRRSEARIEHGVLIRVRLFRDSQWLELSAFTVNVSPSGLLITLSAAVQPGESLGAELPDRPGHWVEAVARHVLPGKVKNLVGLQLKEKQDVKYAVAGE